MGPKSQSVQFCFLLGCVHCMGSINVTWGQEPAVLEAKVGTGLEGRLWWYRWGSVPGCPMCVGWKLLAIYLPWLP